MTKKTPKTAPSTFDTSHFFDLAPELLAVSDLNGFFVKLNSKWTETLGYSRDELRETPFIEFVHPDDRDRTIRETVALFEESYKTVDFQNRYLTKTGRCIWLAWNAIRVDEFIYAMARDITELKNQELYFEETQDVAEIGHWRLDLESNQPVWSKKTYEIHDMEIGSPINLEEAINFYPEGEARERVINAIQKGMELGTSWDLELPFLTAKDRHLWVRAIGKPVVDQGRVTEIYGVFQDITNRKNIELQHRFLMDDVSDGIWDWWVQEDYEFMSPRFWEILGYDASEKRHHPSEWQKLIFEEDLRKAFDLFEKHVDSRGQIPFWLEARYRHKDGSTVWVICQGKVVQWDKLGKPIRVIGSHTDITQLKITQMKLTQNAKLASLGEMAGNIAHEINNPLCIISNWMETLRTVIDNPSPKAKEIALKAINGADETVHRISKIISGMKLLLREGGHSDWRPWTLADILEGTLELCSGKMKSRDIQFDVDLHGGEQLINCNITQISQIVLNLLNNSIHAIQEDSKPWVKVWSEIQGEFIFVYLSDSGPGIPVEKRANIFEPFFTTKPLGEGTGLGLSISKEIAQTHGGNLKYLDDKPNTTFLLSLPILKGAGVSKAS